MKKKLTIVKYIFARYLQGAGCTVIARECERLVFKTKKGTTTWYESGVRGILRNEKYVGDILLGKTFTVDPITKKRLRNFGEEDKYYIESHHEGIVSKEDFLKVQEILDNRGTPRRIVDGKRQEKLSRQYAFSCMIKCGHCGSTFTRRHWAKGESYSKVVWQCINSTKVVKRNVLKPKVFLKKS
jgi:Recombinase.